MFESRLCTLVRQYRQLGCIMKKYSQHATRDFASDIIIEQYVEVERPSGLIVPQHINTVSVERQISAETMVTMSGCGLHYEPAPKQIVVGSRVSEGFVIEAQAQQTFCETSSQMIAHAYKILTYRDVPPRIQFQYAQDVGAIADDDRATMDAVAQAVHDIINEVDHAPVGDGLYL